MVTVEVGTAPAGSEELERLTAAARSEADAFVFRQEDLSKKIIGN